jgi:hypothetical protein
MRLKKRKDKKVVSSEENEREEKYYCSVCRRQISEEEFEAFDGMCWECWDDQLTEESEMMFEDLM